MYKQHDKMRLMPWGFNWIHKTMHYWYWCINVSKCRKPDISKMIFFLLWFHYFCGALIFVDFIVKWTNEMKVRNMTKTFIDRAVIQNIIYSLNWAFYQINKNWYMKPQSIFYYISTRIFNFCKHNCLLNNEK